MAKRYDVIVIGAGPAGLMTAKTAGENGLKVALLERKTDIPKIRRADGGAIGVNEYMFGQMVKFNSRAKRLCFPVGGFSIPYDGPYSNVYGFQIHSPGGQRIFFGDWDEAKRQGDEVRVGISISKEALLQGLLEECRHYEVEVCSGINVTDIKKEGKTVCVTGNGKPFEGIFVVAADGVNSRIARILGFNKERKFLGTERYVTWIMEGEIPIDPGSFNFIFSEKGIFFTSSAYKKGLFHVGAFSFNPKLDLNARIEEFTKEDKTYASWFLKTKKVDVVNCVVNQISPIKEPFKDNILLIGDAAWMLEFSNMAAICSGWKAGNAVTLAILDKKLNREGISSYLEWWEKYFYGPRGAFEFGAGTDELLSLLTVKEIDYIVGLVKEPLPATMNFFTLFTQIGAIFGGIFPTILEERPELMEKLIEMKSKMEEQMEAQIKAGFPNR